MNEYRFEVIKSTVKIIPPKHKIDVPSTPHQGNRPINMSGCVISTYPSASQSPHKIASTLSIKEVNQMGVSVITCTNRRDFITNILENFSSQSYEKKELIIILNNNQLNLNVWQEKTRAFDNIRVYQLDENITLGACLNYGIKHAKYDIIAKFDDDDYYGSNYLSNALTVFTFTSADVVGKAATFVYFKHKKLLAIRNHRRANKYVSRIEGPTIIFRKSIFEVVQFADKNLGEDVQFCKDCVANGYKIYSHDLYNHAYIRHGLSHSHTWGVGDGYYLNLCKIIGEVDDYKSHVTKARSTSTTNNQVIGIGRS